jgi:agmatine/peptidylarginine deiminase
MILMAIDDITRFVNEDTVVTVVEENKNDDNYHLLQENPELLKGIMPSGWQTAKYYRAAYAKGCYMGRPEATGFVC